MSGDDIEDTNVLMQPIELVDGAWKLDRNQSILDRDDMTFLAECKDWPTEYVDVGGKQRTIYKMPGSSGYAFFPITEDGT